MELERAKYPNDTLVTISPASQLMELWRTEALSPMNDDRNFILARSRSGPERESDTHSPGGGGPGNKARVDAIEGLQGWRDGGMEGWKDGGMEGSKDAGMQGCRAGAGAR